MKYQESVAKGNQKALLSVNLNLLLNQLDSGINY